jgi:hypothetical protein
MRYMKVEGNPGLVRDKVTGAILNVNSSEITAARARKKANKEHDQRISNLENDIHDIKALLGTIIEKIDGNSNNI